MEADAMNLPEGYTLDAPNNGLPEGYTIDAPQSDLESAARGALRNIPLAQQAAAAIAPINPLSQEKEYGKELEHLTAAAEQGKAQNPVAYKIGAATGTIAPLFIPGEGEIAAGIKGAGIIGGAANGAAQGISDTNLVKNPGQAAEQAGTGAAVGGVLGALTKYFAGAKPGASKVTEASAPEVSKAVSPEVEKAAVPEAASAAHTPGGIIPDATPVSPDFVPSGDRVAASNFVRGIGFTPRKFQAFARDMGEDPITAATTAEKWATDNGIVKLFDQPGEAMARVSEIKDAAGKTIGKTIEKFGSEKIPVADLSDQINEIARHTIDPNVEAKLLKSVERMEHLSRAGWLDWNGLNEIKGMVGEHAREHPALGRAYGVLADKMTAMADDAGKKIGNPAFKAAYESAKKDYRMASLLKPALTYSESKNLVGGPAGHHTLRGVLGQLVGAMTGLPPVGQFVNNALVKSAPAVRTLGNATAPVAAPVGKGLGKLAGNLPQEVQLGLTNYLESKYGKKGQ